MCALLSLRVEHSVAFFLPATLAKRLLGFPACGTSMTHHVQFMIGNGRHDR